MRLSSMDKIELQINSIKNIVSIKFSDMLIIPSGQVKPGTYEIMHGTRKELFVPMLVVAYGDQKILVLTLFDKHFDFFVKKVKDVYLKEKDRELPGELNKSYINIDERSKKILLSDTITKTSSLYSFYKDKHGYEEPLISNEKEIYGLLPLINYVIESNAKIFKKNYKSNNQLKGYGPRGNYVIFGKIDNNYTPIIMQVKKMDNNTYKLVIGNVINEKTPLEVTISFNKTKLEIISEIKKYNYKYLETYRYDGMEMTSTKEIFVKNQITYQNTIKHEKESATPNISKIDEDDKLDWYKLPWGADLGFKIEFEKIDENITASAPKIQYIGKLDNIFINIESAEKRIRRRANDYRFIKDMVTDDVDKTMIGYRTDGITYIGTTFSDKGAVGEYKENYAGKYFYHVSVVENFEELNKDNIYPIGTEYSVYEHGDLINNFNVKRKVAGK